MQELYCPQISPIHALDGRVKVIFALAFLLFLNLLPQNAWAAFILFLALSLSLALLSRLRIGFVMRRALLALPFMLAAVPLIFSGPPPHASLQLWHSVQLSYSPAGLERFFSIALKMCISVQVAVLLAATTRFPDLLTALQQLRLPALFVAVIGLMGRYLYVIRDEALRLIRARSSRSAVFINHAVSSHSVSPSADGQPVSESLAGQPQHSGGSLRWRGGVTGGMAGSLFLRSLERSDRVYAAMLARGYTGELPAAEITPLSHDDRRIITLSILLLAGLWLLGLLTS